MSWTIAAMLGTYHGVNPAMGWLFATALGLQERRARAVVRALPPIVAGHAASVAVVVAFATSAARVVPSSMLRHAGAALLIGYAVLLLARRSLARRSLARRSHPRRVGMRLGTGGLFAWSFVMASAHGAGLMLLPLLLGAGPEHADHGMAIGGGGVLLAHTVAMLLAMTATALVAFRLSRVDFLRRAWIDTDTVWSATLATSGIVLLVT